MAVLGAALATAARARFAPVRTRVVAGLDAAVREAAGAGVTIAARPGAPVLRIFGDYECPACRRLEDVAGDSLRALARSGRLTLVYHHAPLRAHRRGPLAAAVAYCALGSGLEWSAHRRLYETAAVWRAAANARETLIRIAAPYAGGEARLRTCSESDRTRVRVAADRALAGRLGITAVPTVILDDRRLIPPSFERLLSFVSAAVVGPVQRAGEQSDRHRSAVSGQD